VNQLEITPFCQRRSLVTWCRSRGIECQAWGSLTSGQVLRPAVGQSWPQHFPKEKGRTPEDGPTRSGILESIAAKTSMSVAQVLIRWGLQKGLSVLPRSRHPPHIKENWNARADLCSNTGVGTAQHTELVLSEDQMIQLDELDEGRITCWNPSGSLC